MFRKKFKQYKRGYTFDDGEKIFFNEGKKDKWKVTLMNDEWSWSPRDVDYFNQLYGLGEKYGFKTVYDVFVYVCDRVYKNDWTGKDRMICEKVCNEADKHFEEDTLKLWWTLYMTMLAEENMEGTKLGKSIKNLAVYRVLINGDDIDEVANAYHKKNHRLIQEEIDGYGIVRRYEY